MKKNLKFYTILGIIFTALAGTLLHFVYDWSNNMHLVGFFAPVNESVWEHMKLTYFPMLIYSLWEIPRLRNDFPNIAAADCAGLLAGTWAVPVLFYTYSGILGYHTLPLDIAVFLLSILLAYALRCSCIKRQEEPICKYILGSMVLLQFICFLAFTYNPPSLALFVSP